MKFDIPLNKETETKINMAMRYVKWKGTLKSEGWVKIFLSPVHPVSFSYSLRLFQVLQQWLVSLSPSNTVSFFSTFSFETGKKSVFLYVWVG